MTDAGAGLLISPWLWLVLPAMVGMDSLIPPIPGDELIMSASAVSNGSYGRLALILLLGSLAAFLGDQAAYAVGRAGLRRNGSESLGPRRKKAFDLAQRTLDKGGMHTLIATRFLPGGRTAVNMLAGRIGYPKNRFRAATALGAVISVAYATTLGTLTGKFIHDSPIAVALGGMVLGACIPLLGRLALGAFRMLRGKDRSVATAGAATDLEIVALESRESLESLEGQAPRAASI